MCAALRPRRGVCALQCGCGGDALCLGARCMHAVPRARAPNSRVCVYVWGAARAMG
jgi:hypothetical protein